MTQTRRTFLSSGLATLLASNIGGQEVPKKAPYKEWFSREIKAGTEAFRHPSLFSEWIPTQEEKESYEKRIREKFPSLKSGDLQFQIGSRAIKMDTTPQSWKEYCERQSNIYDACFNFLGVKETKKHTLEILTKETKLQLPTEKTIPIYFALGVFERSKVVHFALSGGKEIEFLPDVSQVFSGLGTWTSYSYGKQGVQVKSEPVQPLLISNQNAIFSYLSGASELLHLALQNDTTRFIEERANIQPKLFELSREYRTAINNDAVAREEGIVHAGIQKFLEATGEREGFTKREIDGVMYDLMQQPTYKYVNIVYNDIGTNVVQDFTKLRQNYFIVDRK